MEKTVLTHELMIGKKSAATNSPSNGPPTIPNILSATCRMKLPKNSARNARPIVIPPNNNAGIGRHTLNDLDSY